LNRVAIEVHVEHCAELGGESDLLGGRAGQVAFRATSAVESPVEYLRRPGVLFGIDRADPMDLLVAGQGQFGSADAGLFGVQLRRQVWPQEQQAGGL
jgi:hypothetical protein